MAMHSQTLSWAVCNDVLPKSMAGKEGKKTNFLMKKPDKHYIYWVIMVDINSEKP